MSSHAQIGINKDNEIKTIYCHGDGYLRHLGVILFKHYSDEQKASELIAHGDASCIYEKIGTEPIDFSRRLYDKEYYESVKNQCVFYARDRQERLSIQTLSKEELKNWMGWNYLFENGKWLVSCSASNYEWASLEDVLRKEKLL